MYIFWILVLVLANNVLSLESGWNGFQVGGTRLDGEQFKKPFNDLQTTFQQNLQSSLQPQMRFGINIPNVVTRVPSTATITSTVSSTTVKSTTVSTTTIAVPNTKSNEKTFNFELCVKQCRITQDFRPVCGSDGVTYKNPSSLKCARDCGINVLLNKPGRCEIGDNGFMTTKPTQGLVTSSLGMIRACLTRCPTTTEYNPVCGSDGVTYANPGRLQCARLCGVDVTITRASKCPPNALTSTTAPVTPSSQTIQACISNCPATTEYNPVCGSDGVTYNNPSRLECAKICGINVHVTRFSRCPVSETSNPFTVATPRPPPLTPTIPTFAPITDRPLTPSVSPVITPSTPSVTPVTTLSTPSVTPVTTPSTQSVTPVTNVPTPTTSGLNFTISQEVLDQIFNTTDYSGLIDERHED